MQCGAIRYTSDSHEQMAKQNFTRLLVPRFTPYRNISEDNDSYANVIQQLAEDEHRNYLIIEDVRKALAENRTPIILTNLTAASRL